MSMEEASNMSKYFGLHSKQSNYDMSQKHASQMSLFKFS